MTARLFLVAFLVAVLPLATRPLAAQTAEDLQRVASRLRTLGALEPLPDSPRNRDVGDVAIIEHDGSSYDHNLPDETLNYEARARVGRRFYEAHADDFDFLVVFTNFEFDTGGALALYTLGRNDVEGIGRPVGSVEDVPFGSRSRLKGWVDMASVSRYRMPPYSLERGGPDFLRTLGVLAHEVGHQWLAQARYKVGETVFDDLLGADEFHWSYLLDSDGSFLYGADWQANGDGTWSAARVREQYSALDLYLMGLLPPEKVAPLTLLRNATIDPRGVNREGETVSADETTRILIDQIVAALGPRRPDFAHAQKEFRLGFVFLTEPGTDPSPEDLEAVERVRRAFGAYFFAMTNGVGWADTRLAATAPAARATSPDLERALAWLAARQGLDGSWADSPETRVRDSATAVLALSRARAALASLQRGVAWLLGAQPESLDFQSRIAASLEPGLLSGAGRQAMLSRVLGGQNPDGGWGAARDFASDGLDTSLALRALKALGHPLDARVNRAVDALARLANSDGGWAAVVGGETSTVVTAEVLLALQDWSEASGAAALRAQGLAALLARRNLDGGFGSSPSTPQASALALEVLLRAGAGAELVEPLTAWLQQAQLADGSWASSPYQTGLVISVLSQSTAANLVVPAATLSISPNPAREGEHVLVSARVRNSGRVKAVATVARLHDGDPSGTPPLAEAAVPELEPGQDAEVAFDYSTVDRPGPRTLHVVADADARVRESREDDNTSAASLTVEGLLADLVVRPEDLTLSPAGPAVGEAVTLVATVRNSGVRLAGPFAVLARVAGPSGASVDLPLGVVPGLGAAETTSVAIAWEPREAGAHTIRLTTDPRYEVPESDETNADVTRRVQVLDHIPDSAQLSVAQASAVPASLQELPQATEVRALVVNSGRAAAATTVELRDGSGESLGRIDLDLSGRSDGVAVLHGTLVTPGGRVLTVVVDPDAQIDEEDETDNALVLGYPDARTLDVEIGAVVLSASDVELDERLTLTVEVKNRGTTDVLSVPVQLAHAAAEGPLELVRANVPLNAGETRTLALTWRASIVGDAVPLVVRVDPFDLLVERREDNNAVPLSLRVRASSLPNLVVSGADVTLDPDPPIEGGAATLSALVRNVGAAPASGSVLRFVVGDPDRDGRTIGEAAVDALAGGESVRVFVAWPRVDVRGSLGLFVIADAGAAVEESNEDDNRAFRPFSAVGLPDLVLAAGDVTLDPAYPREGDTVTIHATVRNLGGRPSAATSLDLAEGDAAARTSVGRLEVPALEPGAFAPLSLAWTPSGAPGERELSLVLDPDAVVTEQDEGNNTVARRVVVQDADLYLSEPVFSPDGDGVKDTTTLAWRATGPVRVVVSNARGEALRALVEAAAASGSVTWDGRDERGLVAWDGTYTFTLVGEGGARLGDVAVVLDTNQSPIHDATPGRTTLRNLTCSLPDIMHGPVLMPAEDEALFIIPDARLGFPVGLLRAGASGESSYVARDEWYRFVNFASPVSPDGREVLVRVTSGAGFGTVYSVDLTTGARRALGAFGFALAWSPDGRFIRTGDAILARDGSLVSTLYGGDWQWAPSSDRLARLEWPEDDSTDAARVVVVARDATPLDSIPIPKPAGVVADDFSPRGLVWRGDGRIVASVIACRETGGEAADCEEMSVVVQPEARSVTRLSFAAGEGAWSPDGSRILFADGELRLESGTSLGPLLPPGATVSPRSSVASFGKLSGDPHRPGSPCGGKFFDTFLVSSAANLVAELALALAPGNGGVVVRGTAADRNLERFQLDYASQAHPLTWHPIGAALDTPVLDDVLALWVPPGPGTYVLRLTVSDQAGHSAVRTRTVSWNRVPVLANFTQSDYYLSPEPNGVKDAVVFRYTVVSPTRVDVRVVGPEPLGPDAPAAQEVWSTAFEHATTGPQTFDWNGHDASDQAVPDGRYTVFINDLPFRVEVDNTPPEIGLRFGEPYRAGAVVEVFDDCNPGYLWRTGPRSSLSSVAADRAWHVVDERLKAWVFRGTTSGAERVIYQGTEPVFVADSALDGASLPGGRPRVRRENGRPADRIEREYVLSYVGRDQLELEAWDLAGNHTEVAVEPPAEALVPLGAFDRKRCEPLASALALESADDAGTPVNGLRPEKMVLQVGTNLRATEQDLGLVIQPIDGGAERRLPVLAWSPHANLDIESFEGLGIDPTLTYRGRFTGQGEAGPVASEPFVFCPCQQWLRAFPAIPEEPTPRLHVVAIVRLDRAVERVRASLQLDRPGSGPTPLGTLDLAPMDEGQLRRFALTVHPGEAAFFAQVPDMPLDCANRLRVEVLVEDVGRQVYPSGAIESACQKLSFELPANCHFGITLGQDFPGCEGSPDQLQIRAAGFADQPARVTIESGPLDDATILEAFDFVPTPENKNSFTATADVSIAGSSGETYPVRGRVIPLDSRFGAGALASLDAVVDRVPPVAEFLLPPEGGSVCLAPGSAAPPLDLLVRFDDAATLVEPTASWRQEGGPWRTLPRVCDGVCGRERSVPVGRPLSLSWNAVELESGLYELQLQACDRAGNRGSATRSVLVTRDPPAMKVVSVQPAVFSPNGDGGAEETHVTLRLFQAAVLSVRVHAGDARGPLVRTLVSEVPQTATDVAVSWDGRGSDERVVPDGEYAVVFAVADACGGSSERSAPVVVDTAPPEAAIAEPTAGQRVSASIDVLGTVMDPHLVLWELDLSCGSSDWTRLATKTFAAAAGSFLARWDTSRAPPGECRLRLVGEDRALNRSPEAFATATVERGAFLDGMSATPEVFSPNGDGRRETATIGYVLARSARVFLEVRDAQGRVLKTLESGSERAAGPWNQAWDGRKDTTEPAAEGLHTVWLRAEDPAVATVYEEKTLRLDLDRTPPQLAISRPTPDGFVAPSAMVRGSMSDRNFAAAVVSATPAGVSEAVELSRLSQSSSSERDLAPLSALADGPHVLRVSASDTAENEAQLEVPFSIDATPPRALIQSPAGGAVLLRGDEPIPVTGLATDAHFASWTLRFGEGQQPAVLVTIAEGTTSGSAIPVGAWDVRFLPDGSYTLSLVAADRAGLTSESRIVVVLDGRTPTVAITQPADGRYVRAPGPVVGTATDANLVSWELEWAPGPAATAYQWSPLGQSRTPVADAALAEWSPLPPDGVHALRLTARDEVGLSSTVRITVTVDATPPAVPQGLAATVTRIREGYGRVAISWMANSEPDLAGYRVRRLPEEAWGDAVPSPAWDDGERLEGRYTYEVLAEDQAGNRSGPARLDVLVDLTPPLVSFAAPAADASVAGALDVRGTAWSAEDFAEYRLLVGIGEAPTAWTLLRRSSVAVAAGRLGEWLALVDGPHVLALEAEDTSGNQARVTRRVAVDTQPPEPPVLLEVGRPASPSDSLVPSWQPGSSPDVVGTLVYRNGRLANATGIVVGDRRGLAVPGTSYEDLGLPDGDHCYHVVALDAAANESLPSNEICRSLDNRAPRALLVHPPDGSRFGFPVRVIAETPDLDVASVRFERRASGSSDWVAFGEVRSAPPWETTLDPEPPVGGPLAAGPHELRAVATDRTAHTDPDPPRITVVYGDTTPPGAPLGLEARVDGRTVSLSWEPVAVADLESYRLYRDGQRIAEGLVETTLADPELELGTYRYVVTAVDADGNESQPSSPADAIVYVVSLEQPVWPVTSTASASVSGSGTRPGTTVSILREETPIAQGPAAGDTFRVDGVPLLPNGNVLKVRAEDAVGNRSLPSDEVVLIANSPPGAVADLEAETTAAAVSLSWTAVADSDLAGYVVRRDGERLTPVVAQDEASSFQATSSDWQAPDAWDANPATTWTPESPGTGAWTIVFPNPVLVEGVRVRFGSQEAWWNPGIPTAYTLLARWDDRELPVVRVRGNTRLVVEHRLPAPLLTTALTLQLESPGGLAEVDVDRLDVRPPGSESFLDEAVPDGRRAYEVAAIDRYGALGAPGSVEAAVGDVDPPSAPLGLTATVAVRDVHLSWSASPEPDVAGYVVLRDAARIATTPTTTYVDRSCPNGTYRYTVVAVDAVAHESAESIPADATVSVAPVPPPAPVILEPTDAAHPISLAASRTDVAGRAASGSTVALRVGGELRGTAPATAGFRELPAVQLGGAGDVALSADGKWAAWSQGLDAISVQDLATGARRLIPHGSAAGARLLQFAPDGTALAFVRPTASGPYAEPVVKLTLADGALQTLASGIVGDYAWSPDGTRLAVSRWEGGSRLSLVDVASGQEIELGESQGLDTHLRWSPDGARLAYVRSWWYEAAELHVVELATAQVRVLDPTPSLGAPSWSSDGRRLAWTTAESATLRVRVQELAAAVPPEDVAEPGNDVLDPRYSPDGDWLSVVRLIRLDDGTTLRAVRAIHQPTGLGLAIGEPEVGETPPDGHAWIGGRLAIRVQDRVSLHAPEAGWFVVRDVSLAPGENRLTARAADPTSGLESPDSDGVLVTVPEHAFPNLLVPPEALLVSPALPLVGALAEIRVRVLNDGDVDAEDVAVRVRVIAAGGAVALDNAATLPLVRSGEEASLLVSWTPTAAGPYSLQVEVDPAGRIAETSEDNNAASRELTVVAGEGLAAAIDSDRASYPAQGTAHLGLRIANAGQLFEGLARTTVEDAAGAEVAFLDERAVALEWGRSVSYSLDWSTRTTWAGRYRFVVRLRATGASADAAEATRAFDIEPVLGILARVRPQRTTLAEGEPAGFALVVQNQGVNAPLAGATARLRLQLDGAPGPARYETVRALPALPPGGAWEALDVWSSAQPAGRYAVRFDVEKDGAVLASSSAFVNVEAEAPAIRGTLSVSPADVLAGEAAHATLRLENRGTRAVAGYPIVVEIVSGPEATVVLAEPSVVDLAPGESRELVQSLATGAALPGRQGVRLRGGHVPVTLDVASLVVHGAIAPPSPHAPHEGTRVATAHPTLEVNDASSPEGAALRYEFEIYGDPALQQALPGARNVPEAPSRTSWTVPARLAEDASYWWRARASDGFSTSAWSALASFTVDAVDEPPSAPVPDTPTPGAAVASRQPALTVRNALDPEGEPLGYEFRVARDAAMTEVVAAQAGLPEGLGLTGWVPPVTLDEDAVYYWSARASTPGGGPEDVSPWSVPVDFRVDTVNESPSAPIPLRPVGGVETTTLWPLLVVENATDPEGDLLTYRFEVDVRPSLDSPERQASAELAPGAAETAWTPDAPLTENTLYYWRARASDGHTETLSGLASFFVNVANEAPLAPVPLDPVDGRSVGTPLPGLCLRNAIDPEGDALSYELEVRDAGGVVVAVALPVPGDPGGTTCASLTTPLAENGAFTWLARASDGELHSPWSAPAAFRVDAVEEPPTAPVPLLPGDGATVAERRPALVVENATSPDALALSYTFELEAVAADGSTTLVERVDGVAETPETTAWTSGAELDDGAYQWRARASDPRLSGPWSSTSRFTILVDPPPAAPRDLGARPGDASVRLDWSPSPEADVTGYRVYRSTISGGPYTRVAEVATPGFDDLGLTNGVTFYYVVTATDATAESVPSNEAAARPEAPSVLLVELRLDPSVIRAECLLSNCERRDRSEHRRSRHEEHWRSDHGHHGHKHKRPSQCPEWLYAAIELPAGHDPALVDVASLVLFGSLRADRGYKAFVDTDHDGRTEIRVRFELDDVAPHLTIGVQQISIVGRAGGRELQGSGRLEVLRLAASLRVTPRTIAKRSCGGDVLAQITFAEGVSASDVQIASVRLNDVVRVDRVVSQSGRDLKLKFDRATVVRALPSGPSVEVRVTGTLRGLPFVAVDHVRVIE